MRISDWSSDVCSSDLDRHRRGRQEPVSGPAGPRNPPTSAPSISMARRGTGGDNGGRPTGAADVSGRLDARWNAAAPRCRSEEHTSELQSLMRISYAVFCLKKKKRNITQDIERRKSTLEISNTMTETERAESKSHVKTKVY